MLLPPRSSFSLQGAGRPMPPHPPAATMIPPAPWAGLPGVPPVLHEVRERIRPHLRETPLVRCPALDLPGSPVWIKDETRQETGSFKLRGAAAMLTSLPLEEAERGVVTCSSGNHGRAVAWMASRLGLPATIFVPDWVDPVKLAAIRDAGAEAVLAGTSYDEAEAAAAAFAHDRGRVLVPPFDHPAVIAGQGSVGLEVLDRLPGLARVVVPLSGGGLVAGIGLALRQRGSSAELVAVSARRARVMRASLEAGRPVELPEEPTLAGALAGGIGRENQWTLPLVERLVDRHLEVEEEEIALAMAFLSREAGIDAEGGGAVGVAALLSARSGESHPRQGPGQGGPHPGWRATEGPTVVIVSGGNVDPSVLARILSAT